MRNILKAKWNPLAFLFFTDLDVLEADLKQHEEALQRCELHRIKLEYSYKSLRAQQRFLLEGTEESA